MYTPSRIVNEFYYIGGQLNVENLAGNQFVNFAVVAFTEFPTVFIGEFIINKLGRRWTHFACMVVSAAFYVAIIPIADSKP